MGSVLQEEIDVGMSVDEKEVDEKEVEEIDSSPGLVEEKEVDEEVEEKEVEEKEEKDVWLGEWLRHMAVS